MAENPGLANIHTVRPYPSSEALREVVEAQRRFNKLKKAAHNSNSPGDAPRSPTSNTTGSTRRPPPPSQERENIPSGTTPSMATSAAADVARAQEWMRQRAMKRNSLEKVKSPSASSDDDARRSRRHIVLEQGSISISVQELNKAPVGSSAMRAPVKVPRGLEILDEEEETDTKRVSDSDSRRIPDAKAQRSARQMPAPSVWHPSASHSPLSNLSKPPTSPGSGSNLSLSTDGDSGSSRTSRGNDANQFKNTQRSRTVSESAAKAPEVFMGFPPMGGSSIRRAPASSSPPTATMPASTAGLDLFGPDPRKVVAPVPQAPATGSAFRYISGEPFQQKTSRSASDTDKAVKRPIGGVPPAPPPTPALAAPLAKPRFHNPASAWRTIPAEDAARIVKKQTRFEIIPEEDASSLLSPNVPTIYVPSAPSVRRSSFDSTTSSSSQRSQFVNTHRRTPSAPVVPNYPPSFARVILDHPMPMPSAPAITASVARPRPPPHIRSLMRKKKTLSGASMEVWTGDMTDPELSAPESNRSSIYSVIPPPDSKVLIEQWMVNDERQVRTLGKRHKPGVTFDFPEEDMPATTRLTESQVELLPDAVLYHNER